MCQVRPTETDALSRRLFGAAIGTLELYGVYLGKTLGLYKALDRHGPLTSAELASVARIHGRYAREWLEQQAVAGFLAVETATDDGAARRYVLPEAHRAALVDPTDAGHTAPLAQMLVGIAGALPEVAHAYRTGGGLSYRHYGADLRHGMGGINRPLYSTALTTRWLPQIADIHRRLRMRPPARIADVGCGQGWSTIAMAKAYPLARVNGYDVDRPSIIDAERNALRERALVRFETKDASALAADGPFDLILVLEALHDMARPTAALAAMRRALAPGGSVVVADEKVADRFAAPGDERERMTYGWSITCCLPMSMNDHPTEAIGTTMRAETVRTLANDAGFGRVEVLDIDTDLLRFYRLRP